MRYAFLIMGAYDPERDDVRFQEAGGISRMIGVPDLESAERIAADLADDGYAAIELCGAFGEEGARRIIEATGHRIAVGYVTHFCEDDELFAKVFGR